MKRCMTALAVLLLAGCDQTASRGPVAPTPVQTAAPAPSGASGDIRLGSVTHSSGSTLVMQDCGPSWTGIAGNHVCNEDWRGAFDVVLDRDVSDTTLLVSFFDGAERCGDIYASGQAFTAHRARLVSTSSALYFTYEPEGYENLSVVQRCTLPRTTTRLVVTLWSRHSASVPLLRREFDHRYTFISR
jgi:hypothetical protein